MSQRREKGSPNRKNAGRPSIPDDDASVIDEDSSIIDEDSSVIDQVVGSLSGEFDPDADHLIDELESLSEILLAREKKSRQVIEELENRQAQLRAEQDEFQQLAKSGFEKIDHLQRSFETRLEQDERAAERQKELDRERSADTERIERIHQRIENIENDGSSLRDVMTTLERTITAYHQDVGAQVSHLEKGTHESRAETVALGSEVVELRKETQRLKLIREERDSTLARSREAIDDLERERLSTQIKMEELEKTSGQLQGEIERLGQGQERLHGRLGKMEEANDVMRRELADLEQVRGRLESQEVLAKTMADIRKQLDRSEARHDTTTAEIEEFTEGNRRLKSAVDSLKRSNDRLHDDLSTAQQEKLRHERRAVRLEEGYDQATRATARLEREREHSELQHDRERSEREMARSQNNVDLQEKIRLREEQLAVARDARLTSEQENERLGKEAARLKSEVQHLEEKVAELEQAQAMLGFLRGKMKSIRESLPDDPAS